MKTLVVYQTKGGASKTYAEAVAGALKEKGHEITLIDLKESKPDIASYDLIIAGTGVRIFRVYGKWKYILKHKQTKSKKLALFLSSGTAIDKPDEALDKWVKPLVAKYKLNPISLGSFPGIIPGNMDPENKMQNKVDPELARQWAFEIDDKIRS